MSEVADRIDLPDRVRLPIELDAPALAADLRELDDEDWVDHVVKHNYDGDWRVVPLRAALGETHPLRMSIPDPAARAFVDTVWLGRVPRIAAALKQFRCPLRSVRLMRLAGGSRIKEHCDPGLDAAMGWARLHVPIETDSSVEFRVNGRAVPMTAGSVWYLRLIDPHAVDNRGRADRTHLVVDADVNEWLADMLQRGAAMSKDAV